LHLHLHPLRSSWLWLGSRSTEFSPSTGPRLTVTEAEPGCSRQRGSVSANQLPDQRLKWDGGVVRKCSQRGKHTQLASICLFLHRSSELAGLICRYVIFWTGSTTARSILPFQAGVRRRHGRGDHDVLDRGE
jgi:hypothetical protein